ncbi:hypothetical protein VPH35_031470 [Triticum aestivum]
MGKVKNRDWMEMLEAEDRPSASSSWRRTISVTGHWMGWSTRQRSCRYVVEPRRRVRRLATGNRAGEEASELGAGVIPLTTSRTYYVSHHVERYKSVLYFIEQQHEIMPPLAPGACCCPPFSSYFTCFTLCEVVYFQLYKAISYVLKASLRRRLGDA